MGVWRLNVSVYVVNDVSDWFDFDNDIVVGICISLDREIVNFNFVVLSFRVSSMFEWDCSFFGEDWGFNVFGGRRCVLIELGIVNEGF